MTRRDYPFLSLLKRHPLDIDSLSMQGKTYLIVKEQPEFIGGNEALNKFLSKNTNQKVKGRGNVSGTVFVQFIIDIEGNVTDVSVLKGLRNSACDAEAVRVISSLPKWKPGRQEGVRVRVRFVQAVRFN